MPTVPVRTDRPWLKSHFPSGSLYPSCSSEGPSAPGVPANSADSRGLICYVLSIFLLTQLGGKPELKERWPRFLCLWTS